jgi:hypothetical protein
MLLGKSGIHVPLLPRIIRSETQKASRFCDY